MSNSEQSDGLSSEEVEELINLKKDVSEGVRSDQHDLSAAEVARLRFHKWRSGNVMDKGVDDGSQSAALEKAQSILKDPNDEKVVLEEVSPEYIYFKGVEIIKRGTGFSGKERLILAKFVENLRKDIYSQVVNDPDSRVEPMQNGDKVYTKRNSMDQATNSQSPTIANFFSVSVTQTSEGKMGNVNISATHSYIDEEQSGNYDFLTDGSIKIRTSNLKQRKSENIHTNFSKSEIWSRITGKQKRIMNGLNSLLHDINVGVEMQVMEPTLPRS